jgi:hypothetical protein
MTLLTSATRSLNGVAGVVTPRWACGPARGRITKRMQKISYVGIVFPPEIIHRAIWSGTAPRYVRPLLASEVRGYALFAREM